LFINDPVVLIKQKKTSLKSSKETSKGRFQLNRHNLTFANCCSKCKPQSCKL